MSTRKKMRLGHIDVDPEQFVLIAAYSTEITTLDESGNVVSSESQQGSKNIRVPRGLSGPDIPGLAQEVVEKCKYIHASKVPEVERLLHVLMEYEQGGGGGGGGGGGHRERDGDREPSRERRPHTPQGKHDNHMSKTAPAAPLPVAKRQVPLLPSADVRFIEEYADQLYEDKMELKVAGAKCILRVCTEPANLEILAKHDTLLSVLSRELRESSKKSFELSVVIVCTALCFSHFSQFHPVLSQHGCGGVILQVVEYESQRAQVRKEDMEQRIGRLAELQDKATGDDRRQLAKEEKKYKIQLNRQNRLIHVCMMGLLNLAEDIAVERKMVNRKMPSLLVQLLDRTHEDLLLVSLQFLKKLSIFEDNKEAMMSPETLSRLVQLAQHSNVRVALLTLRVMYNLSFDEGIRASLVESGIVKLLVDLLRNPPFRHIVLRLLYHFSMDDRCKSLMAYYQDGMTMLLQLVVHFPEQRVGKDLVALVVNLATHPRAAEVMMNSGLFGQVVLRVIQTRDPWLCKVIRHVSSHEDVVQPMYDMLASDSVRMSQWMREFVRMALCGIDNPDLLVEVLGTLANMNVPDTPWGELCETGLIDLLHRLLVPGFSEDDVVLECVMLIGNMATSLESSQHIAGSRLPQMLQEILIEKCEDEEIVLQLLFTFHCLLIYDEVRDVILHDTEIVQCVIRFARAKRKQIIDQAMATLEVVAEHVGDFALKDTEPPAWAEQVKQFRFEQSNAQWMQYINREMSGAASSPSAFYDDRQDSGQEDEEEFAFHWAGGDAGDVNDIANRDWGNKDMESFMHSSRFVS
eukprot:TRINITY_DN9161_c0_g1_i1.p1 TRINITY_DN9161_c0_g1~~TRINITY_DN9161_c0_g1_i1.p1  ORF type:complete len:802 (+),score=184.38 TRINITY_DN9161_c0_g1_i1:126-2531(+)